MRGRVPYPMNQNGKGRHVVPLLLVVGALTAGCESKPPQRSERQKFGGHKGGVAGLAFSPNGKTLACIAHGQPDADQPGTVRLWDVATGKLEVKLQDRETPFGGSLYCVAFSPDGHTLAVGAANEVLLWDLTTQPPRFSALSTRPGVFNARAVTALAFSPNGKTLAIGSDDNLVRLWDLGKPKARLALKGHTKRVTGVAFAPTGPTIISASLDGTVRLWDAVKGKELATVREHSGPVSSLAVGPQGKRLATAGWDKTVRIWDLTSSTARQRVVLQGHQEVVSAVAISPDGKTLVSGGKDKMVKVWDTVRERPQFGWEAHGDAISVLAISPDGKTLASGSADGTVKLWDMAAD